MTLNIGSVPAWNSVGVLPPIRPDAPGHSPDRSPYTVELTALIDRFATSQERVAILGGLLRLRAALHQARVVSGFQWLDGSFLESVETLEQRAPRDMDVVTFLHLPSGQDQRILVQANSHLFDPKHLKATYFMDAYFMVLGQPSDAWQVKKISYWYSMWSHRRDGLWKGFVQVDLDPSQDDRARAVLNHSGGIHHE